ncbi:UNVERIFIED_CONTAM: hypothetical protein Sradi_6247700 [Sesamum radiatum]|uniref:Uncharacterized protein n=1 Tax=Sesamum radiatum TaxID=300843 RepID=A0AAW2KAB2_SESRA
MSRTCLLLQPTQPTTKPWPLLTAACLPTVCARRLGRPRLCAARAHIPCLPAEYSRPPAASRANRLPTCRDRPAHVRTLSVCLPSPSATLAECGRVPCAQVRACPQLSITLAECRAHKSAHARNRLSPWPSAAHTRPHPSAYSPHDVHGMPARARPSLSRPAIPQQHRAMYCSPAPCHCTNTSQQPTSSADSRISLCRPVPTPTAEPRAHACRTRLHTISKGLH